MATDSIPRLLQQGLDHYGRNEVDEAVTCWLKVLALDPGHVTARDYLEAAGVPCPKAPASKNADIIDFGAFRAQVTGDAVQKSSSVRELEQQGAFKAQLSRLLSERRYQDALDLLCQARAQHPDDAEVSRSIRLLRERLARLAGEPSGRHQAQARPMHPQPPSLASEAAREPSHDDDFRVLFQRATEAYMLRDYRSALRLFAECQKQRPDDRRVSHNLSALRRRLGQG